MAEEQKDTSTEDKMLDESKSTEDVEKQDEKKTAKAWESKVEDTSGRDWSKPKSFKPSGTV